MIESEKDKRDGRGKVEYRLTEAGRVELERWRAGEVGYLPNREPFLLWMSYLDVNDMEALQANVDRHVDRCQAQVDRLTDMASSIRAGTWPILEIRRDTVAPDRLEHVRAARGAVAEILIERTRRDR